MNTFFGVIKLSKAASVCRHHIKQAEICKQKFPLQWANMQRLQTPEVDLSDDFSKSEKPGLSRLCFCGELYNAVELADYIKQPEAAHWPPAVLVHELLLAKGADSVAKINGRFLICYADEKTNTIQLFNDQMGIQQVFYYSHKDFILFGSEIKFLLCRPLCPRKIDWVNAFKRPLPFIVGDGERHYNAWFEGIDLMKEASALTVDIARGQVNFHTYWDPCQSGGSVAYNSAGEIMEAYMALLDDAVRIRVQDSDRAFSFLSGGLDSSILCALARQYKPLDTYSIITHTTLLDGATEASARLSQELHFSNTQYSFPYNQVAFDTALWKKRVWNAESPFAHHDSIGKTLLHYAINKYETPTPYVLTGTGSDQLNGGLARWIVTDQDDPASSWNALVDKLREAELSDHLPQQYPALWGARNYLSRDFVQTVSGRSLEKNNWLYYIKSNLHINLFSLLWDENRAAAAHGRSVRYPFLDYRFAEFMANVPARFFSQLFYDKQILRTPAAKYLPDYIVHKPKSPAFLGNYDKRNELFAYLVNHEQHQLVWEALGEPGVEHPVVDKKALLSAIQRLTQNPDPVEWQYLLHIVNLGLLEKLADQDENSLNYERRLEERLERITAINPATLSQCYQHQGVLTESEIWEQTPVFVEGCALVHDPLNGCSYLVKNEVLVYEIEADNAPWKRFISAIDHRQTLRELIEGLQIDFEDIREYFYLCLKENILTTR